MSEDDIIFEEKDNGAWIPGRRSPVAWYGAFNDPEWGNLQLTARGLTLDPQSSILSSGRGILHLPTKDMISVKLNHEGTSLSGFKISLSSHTDVAFKVKEPALWIEHLKAILATRAFQKAKQHEKLLEFDEAAEIYKKYGMDDDVIRVREEARNKVSQTVVHGDYVDDRDTTYIDDRDTIIKDSVISKSNVGAGGDDKLAKIKELKELLDSGAIDKDDYEKMKREIIG